MKKLFGKKHKSNNFEYKQTTSILLAIIKTLKEVLAQQDQKIEKLFIDNLANLSEKISVLETCLEEIFQKSDNLNKLIIESKLGEKQKLLLINLSNLD